jgi:5'-3' exoribonuclease 1
MGLPGFFAWILKHYAKEILSSCLKNRPKYLYIDANCLFHPECFKILEGFPNASLEELKKYMFQRIVNFLDFLEQLVNPTEMMYIAVDGTAPLAKIIQQRKRRYKSELDNFTRNEIKIKYGMTINDSWSNTSITPGTEFMYDLHKYLIEHYKKKDHNKLKYIYSSYHTPGEGEHKILQHIKKNTEIEDSIVIYGLDADLIFLSMASKRPNIYLLREQTLFKSVQKSANKIPSEINSANSTHVLAEIAKVKDINAPNAQNTQNTPNTSTTNPTKMMSPNTTTSSGAKSACFPNIKEIEVPFDYVNDVSKEMIFVSIKETREAYNKDIKHKLESFNCAKIIKEIDFSNDLIFVCFLLGNDFLPHFPSVNIHNEGLDELIESYLKTLLVLKSPLIGMNGDNVQINNLFFQMMLEDMGKKEEDYFCDKLYMSVERHKRRRCYEEDAYKKELWEMDNLKNGNIKDTLQLGIDREDVWRYRYYEHYFKLSGKQDNFIEKLSELYLGGIKWITQYYFFECADWKWSYPCHHAPFISDMAKYMQNKNIDLNKILFNNNKHIPMMSQLVSVFPPSCKNYLPESYKYLVSDFSSPIIDMFPKNVQIDTLYKNQLYQCVPFIPYLDIERVLEATKDLPLTKHEQERCEIMEDIVF